MPSEQQKHIQKIREEFNNDSQRSKDSLNNAIRTLSNDLYSKDTHFIFELVQNAEDNEYNASEPSLYFVLKKNDPTGTLGADGALIVLNNEIGFSYENVDAICAVGESTKSKQKGYIGEKGIGFKSVFRVSNNPHIFSNNYRFCLPEKDEKTGLGYIVPRWIEKTHKESEHTKTNIILPLKPDFGFEQIKKMLRDIKPETILFLSKLKEIHIKTDDGDDLTILKDDTKFPLIQMMVEGKKTEEAISLMDEFLLFTDTFSKPSHIHHEKRKNIDMRDVSIAFSLNEDNKFDGEIFAYLPLQLNTNFPFIINADFILPSSRENISDRSTDLPWNRWLMECVANLVSKALPVLKERKLLTVSLLEKLSGKLIKISEDDIFYPIVEAAHEALMEQELIPANDGTFVSAKNAKLAAAADLRALLPSLRLKELYQSEQEIKWLSAEVTEGRTPNLRNYLMKKLNVSEIDPDGFARKVTESFFQSQPDEWMISFYIFLSKQKALWKKGSPNIYWDKAGPIRSKPFIRLQDGSHIRPFKDDDSPNAYLAIGEDADTNLPIVKTQIAEDEEVFSFLKDQLHIPELDIVAEVIEKILKVKYTENTTTITLEEHLKDIAKIEKAYTIDSEEKKKTLKEQLLNTPFVLTENPFQKTTKYLKPTEAYFSSNELLMYFSDNDSIGFVSQNYKESILKMLEDIGVNKSVKIKKSTSNQYGYVIISSSRGSHKRGLNRFAPDIWVDGLEWALTHPNMEKSMFIWNNIAFPHSDCVRGTVEESTKQTYEDSSKEDKISGFGHFLIESNWLPGPDEDFHTPNKLGLDDLPDSFIRDIKLRDQLAMKKDIVAALAKEINVPEDYVQFMLQNKEKLLPEYEQWKTGKDKPKFPEKKSPNPDRREEKKRNQFKDSTKKEYKACKRQIRVTQATEETRAWLRKNYTNDDDQMICQICKDKTFIKRNGEYYFEAVESLSNEYFSREGEAQFLALCPLCAAKYKEFVKKDESAMKTFKFDLMNYEQPEIPLMFGDKKTSIRFVEDHWQDIRTIIQMEEE